LDFAGTGMSVLEVSHRSPEYDEVHQTTQARIKRLLGLGDDYKVLFMGGGASTQFALIPLNFLHQGQTADYINTGTWSTKAIKEAQAMGGCNVAASSEAQGFTRIPTPDEYKLTDGAAYLHITSNNTIKGTQWHSFPDVDVPLIADMSSDILWAPFDAGKFSMIYAGAQKNLGPAGVTVVILREEMLERCRDGVPTMFRYKTHVEKNSLFNTPPCFPIYMVGKVLEWIEDQGGLEAVEKVNRKKGDLLYGTLARYSGFFKAPVQEASRSYMNVVFRLPTEELEQQFVAEGKQRNMNGLKGHRSVGGIRVSIYNAVELSWVEAVAAMMEEFAKRHG
jgi:phosphoserine aminotransferase